MYKSISLTIAMICSLSLGVQAQIEQTQPGLDDSEITIEESNGTRTVRRFLNPNSKVERVEIVSTPDGKRVTKVYMRSGEVRELTENNQLNVLEESSDTIAINSSSASDGRSVKEKVKASPRTVTKGTKATVGKAGDVTRGTAETTVRIGEAAGEGVKGATAKTVETAQPIAESTISGVETVAKGTAKGVGKAAEVSAAGTEQAWEVGKTSKNKTKTAGKKTREVSTTVAEKTASGSVAVAEGAGAVGQQAVSESKNFGEHVVGGFKKVGSFIKGVFN